MPCSRDGKIREIYNILKSALFNVLSTEKEWSLSLWGDRGHLLKGGGFDMDVNGR